MNLFPADRRLTVYTHEDYSVTETPTLRSELDRLRCDVPGCTCSDDDLVLQCRDHHAPTHAVYSKGELRLECSVCERVVVVVPIAG